MQHLNNSGVQTFQVDHDNYECKNLSINRWHVQCSNKNDVQVSQVSHDNYTCKTLFTNSVAPKSSMRSGSLPFYSCHNSSLTFVCADELQVATMIMQDGRANSMGLHISVTSNWNLQLFESLCTSWSDGGCCCF